MRDSVHIQDFQDTVKKFRSMTLIIDSANNLNTGAEKYPFVPSTSSILNHKEAVFTLNSILNRKVVPKSVVNPDFLEPLNCKGLFTTTHANTHRPLIKPMIMASGEHHAACSTLSIECEFDRLPDRNPGSGLIGIGLVSVLRTLFMKININPLIGGLA